jgi:putative ABC transport system permease protein
MPANYLKIAARRLLRQKTFSLINIFGLSMGLAACLLLYLYVRHELSYDTYHPHAERIVRLTTTIHSPGSDVNVALTPFAAGANLLRSFPEVQAIVRIDDESDLVIKSGTEILSTKNFMYSEPAIFSIFGLTFLEGTAAGALSAPNSLVLSRSAEKEYFGNRAALGRTLECNRKPYRVTAVFADQPSNTDLRIEGIISKDFSNDNWEVADDNFGYTYVLFRQKPDLAVFNQRLSRLTALAQPSLDENLGKSWRLKFHAEALSDVHFSKGLQGDTPKGDRQFDRIFLALAIFILLIALLNYINLATARAAERAKEVGIRKVVGATPRALLGQFLAESALLVTIAWLVAVGLVALALPFFNRMLDTELSWTGWTTFLIPILLFPLTVLLAGGYPAFVLSRFRPISVLKGNRGDRSSLSGPAKGATLRKVLTVTQFVIALAMLAGVVVFFGQMQFMQHRDLGLDQRQVLHLSVPQDSVSAEIAPAFYQALRQESGIHGVTVGTGLPTGGAVIQGIEVNSKGKKRQLLCNGFFIDPQFLPMMHIVLAEGRNFSAGLATDSTENYIVNQAFVRTMGWKSGLGQSISSDNRKGKIIGVVKDFFWKSLHNSIDPAMLIYKTDLPNAVLVKTTPSEIPRLKQLWKNYFPSDAFEYWFMDEAFNAQYKSDRITQFLFNAFTGLAILISCLGLFGLVSLVTLQRAKEIAIRNVLGASTPRLVLLLLSGQLWLIACAAVIALPLAAVGAHQWLSSYAYHTSINIWMFVLPVATLLLLAMVVTGYRICRVAMANPVSSLKVE